MLKFGRFRCSPGFVLVVLAFALLDREGLWSWCLLACAVHELGHYAAVKLTGGHLEAFELTAVGGRFSLRNGARQSYLHEFLVLLAGPGANFAAAGLALAVSGGQALLCAGFQVAIGLFNLLPIYPLDGGRLFELGLEYWFPAFDAEGFSRMSSLVLCLLLLGLGGLVFTRSGGNFTLALVAAWLLADLLRWKKVAKPGGSR